MHGACTTMSVQHPTAGWLAGTDDISYSLGSALWLYTNNEHLHVDMNLNKSCPPASVISDNLDNKFVINDVVRLRITDHDESWEATT